MMLSIGEFSKVSGLTIKALRFYHQRGLLIPARIEAGSGYRFYDQRNLKTAQLISILRALEFKLDDIQTFLAEDNENNRNILEYLEKRKGEVEDKIQSQQELLYKLDQIIKQQVASQQFWDESKFEVEHRELKPTLVGGIRVTGRYSDIGESFGKLGRTLGPHIAGPAMCLYYDDEYREEDADFEPAFPIVKKVEVADISVRELPGGNSICLKHLGPYEELWRSYTKLFRYANEQGLQRVIPSREVYLNAPTPFSKVDPSQYVTEIQFIIDRGEGV